MKLGLSRRQLLRDSTALLAGMAISESGFGALPTSTSDLSLKQIAAQRGILYGAEAVFEELHDDKEFAALFVEQCGILTPGVEAKWADVEPEDGEFHFEHLDWMVDFAEKNGIKIRGHNLMWSVYNPAWARAAVSLEGRGSEILQRHITTEVARYRGRISYWDVANEVTDPLYNPLDDGLVDSMWHRHVGPLAIDDAFKWTYAADPTPILFVNDDNLEYDSPDREEKRNTYLRLVETWLKRGVPITGFGLESHLRPLKRIDEKRYRRFLAELAGMGLTIHITELDIIDRDLPADIALRDKQGADFCKRFLDIALDEPAVKAVITWGLSDRYTGMDGDPDVVRPDGLPSRCLPYDRDLKAKPMWHAIADALRHAPAR